MKLEIRNLTKAFGGVRAIDDVSLAFPSGSLSAVIGPNGAGKTTLFSIISGFQKPDGGRIVYDGGDISGEPPYRLARRGIARTFQIVQPFAGLTVRENIAIGTHASYRGRSEALAAAGDIAQSVGLTAQLDTSAATLTVAGRKRLELARALAIAPRLLLLDIGASGMAQRRQARCVMY